MITPFTKYAGFGRRALALVVNILWIFFLCWLVYGSCELKNDMILHEWQTADSLKRLGEAFLIYNVPTAFLVILFWMSYGATPGKLLLDCEIVDAQTGEPITLKQALLRYVGYYLSALFMFSGFLWIIWDKRKQGWHDKIAGTVVIMHDEATISLQQLESYFR